MMIYGNPCEPRIGTKSPTRGGLEFGRGPCGVSSTYLCVPDDNPL